MPDAVFKETEERQDDRCVVPLPVSVSRGTPAGAEGDSGRQAERSRAAGYCMYLVFSPRRLDRCSVGEYTMPVNFK